MGKYDKKLNCTECSKQIRSDRMKIHMDTHVNGRGKFSRKSYLTTPVLPGPSTTPVLPGPMDMTSPVLPCP